MNGIIIPLALGFLLGNGKARAQLAHGLQQLSGMGIDALNKMGNAEGVNADVSKADTAAEQKQPE